MLGLLFGAPVSAEYLQAYLTATGDAVELVAGLLFFAPLYGGAALVIREVAVRSGRGWPGILLLGGAFGVIMQGLVDLSLFTKHEPDITGWDDIWSPTAVPVLGISVYALIAFTLGHVLMSIGVPIALVDALAPKVRGRSLVGWKGPPCPLPPRPGGAPPRRRAHLGAPSRVSRWAWPPCWPWI